MEGAASSLCSRPDSCRGKVSITPLPTSPSARNNASATWKMRRCRRGLPLLWAMRRLMASGRPAVERVNSTP